MEKDNRRYLFVGARFNVLEKMLDLKLNIVKVLVTNNSFAQRGCDERNIKYTVYSNKPELLEMISNTDFDVLVSNGCPYILPVTNLKKHNELFINIHPGLLPEFRGINPVNAAVKYNKPQGVTCHIMDDGIDTGTAISRVTVCKKPNTLPLELLYKLSFMAEGDAFLDAYKKNFKPRKVNTKFSIYYSRKPEDQLITSKDTIDSIVTKVKMFQVEGQYARFINNEQTYFVKDILKFNNEYLDSHKYKNKTIVMSFNNKVITKEKDCYLLWTLNTNNNLNIKNKLL